jgi:hypothetical protein
MTSDNDKSAESLASGITDTIKEYLNVVESTGTSLASEVKQLFDDLTVKVTEVAGSVTETTVSMAEKVTVKEPAELIRSLLEEVKHASEVSIQVIGERFDDLRNRVEDSGESVPKTKAATKKKTARKKTASKKKAVAKKKAVVKKRSAAKKKVVKKQVAKKKVVKKKVAKKQTSKKSPAPKKQATRKKAVSKRVSKKQ